MRLIFYVGHYQWPCSLVPIVPLRANQYGPNGTRPHLPLTCFPLQICTPFTCCSQHRVPCRPSPPTSPTSCVTCRGHMRCKQKCPRKAVLASSSQSLPSSPAHAHLSMPRLCQTRRHPNQPNRPHAPLQDALGVQTSQICCKSGALPLIPALPRPFCKAARSSFPLCTVGHAF